MSRPRLFIYHGSRGLQPHIESLLGEAGFEAARLSDLSELRQAVTSVDEAALVIAAGCTHEDVESLGAAVADGPVTHGLQFLWIAPGDGDIDPRLLDGLGFDWVREQAIDHDLAPRVHRLRELLGRIAETQDQLSRLSEIGISLSSEHNLDRLLERILDEARAINLADAGTLYTIDADAGVLRFQIIQNDTLGVRLGGSTGSPISLEPVPLCTSNVSGYVALSGKPLNIIDVYQAEGFDFSGTRKYDERTGYRCRSMLVVPMMNHEDEVIAVLQLINARKPGTERIVPFLEENVARTQALASQAGIALNNARLIHDLQALFEGVVKVMAKAVDEKSPYTSGHIQRVTRLAVLLAEAVNSTETGSYACRAFDHDELNELRIAGLLHDIGKIVIPEHIVDKATKLQCLRDGIHEIRTRWSLIRRGMERDAAIEKLRLAREGAPRESDAGVDLDLERRLKALYEDLEFIESCNEGGEYLPPERVERLRRIGSQRYLDDAGLQAPYLTDYELRSLCITRGTLLPEELQVIRSHAEVSIRLLNGIPFSRRLRGVPTYAGDHHEMLDGSGYPRGKTAEQLPVQSRILAVADIYDALTASDRPYKKAFTRERAYAILREEAARGRLDQELVELFISEQVAEKLQAELEQAAASSAAEADAVSGSESLVPPNSHPLQPGLLGATRASALKQSA